jgi:hypothetical protein
MRTAGGDAYSGECGQGDLQEILCRAHLGCGSPVFSDDDNLRAKHNGAGAWRIFVV